MSPSPTPAACAPRTRFSRGSSVRTGQTVARGDVLGATGGTGPDHDGAVLHLGLRVGDRYVDPMQLFRPDDLTKLVHLVPADEPGETPWSPERERRDLQASLRLPVPGASGSGAHTDGDDCDTDLPFVGDAVDAVCGVGAWLGDHAGAALDGGIDFLDSTTDLAADVLDDLRSSSLDTLTAMQSLAALAASRSRTHRPARSPSTSLPSAGASPTA